MKFATYKASIHQNRVRVEEFDGDVHVVAPVVAVQESVLKGNYLPAEEIQASAPAFNGTPLPVGHPMEGGEFVSANTPERIQTQSVGQFFNVAATDTDGVRIQGETWVNAPKSVRLAEQDPLMGAPLALLSQHLDDPGNAGEFIDALPSESHDIATQGDEGGLLEVSTAYWFDPEESPGSFNGNEYAAIQRHVRPDHLALLPHQEGECSVADGCGAPRANQQGGAGDGGTADTPTAEQDSAMNTPNSNPTTLGSAAAAIGRFAHNCVCGGCAGCSDDIMKPEELADLTGISLDVLEAMSDEDRTALASLATHDDDGDQGGHDHDGDGDGASTTTSQDAPQDGVAEAVSELRQELAETREEMAEVREAAMAQQQAEKQELVDAIEPHSSLERESLEGLSQEVLQGMAQDLTPSARADFGGRVRGIPSASHTSDGVDDERLEEAQELVGQLSGKTPATDGGTNQGDE